jgi:hypothetical protein
MTGSGSSAGARSAGGRALRRAYVEMLPEGAGVTPPTTGVVAVRTPPLQPKYLRAKEKIVGDGVVPRRVRIALVRVVQIIYGRWVGGPIDDRF